MNVIFFEVDGVLNTPDSEAKAPDGSLGIAEASVKNLRSLSQDNQAKLVLTGSWADDWDFNDDKCTPKGVYLNKKLDRRGLHILDKTDDILDWLERHSNVEDYCILKGGEKVVWRKNI